MKLPYDVLFSVMEVQSTNEAAHDLAFMSRTSHTLRVESIKYLLNRCITLRDDKDVLSFSLFMLADEPRRLPLLRRSLHIKAGALQERAAISLIRLICKTSHLERLALFDADRVLASDPLLPRAFARLACLKHLDFYASDGPGHADSAYMLKHLQSRLVSVSIQLPSPIHRWANGVLDQALSDPVRLLRNSADTLTELCGSNLEITRRGVTYPNVTRLGVHLGPIPLIAGFIVSFPNVSSLQVSCETVFEPTMAQTFNFANQGSQEEVGCWSALEELSGSLTDVYVLALQCRVATLRVRCSGPHLSLHYLAEVLTRTQPEHLQLEVESSAFCVGAEDSLSAIFRRSEAARCVQTLEVRIMLRGEDCKAELDELFTRVIETVEMLPLTSFTARISHEILDTDVKDTVRVADNASAALLPSHASTSCLLETKLRAWDAARHLDRVRQACPSLQKLTVQGSGCSVVPLVLLSVYLGGNTGQ